MTKKLNPYGDFEPKLSYDSKPKRELKKRLWRLFYLIIIALLLGFAVHRLHAEASCVVSPSHGYYVRDICPPNNSCCELLTPKMVDGHIQLN